MSYASGRPVLSVGWDSSERTRPAGIKQVNLTQGRHLTANVTRLSFESENATVKNFRRLSLTVSARSKGKLPKYKCMVCGDGLNAMKCKCGNKDENKFAFSNRCTDCEGEGVRSCFKCGGAGEITKYSGLFFARKEVGVDVCKKCSGERVLACQRCQGAGQVFYRNQDWR
ncbi:hypothetical protein CYMTET_19203 [Cymbomonas tetramitiformis]|uniref:Uncharacterized protein n=1 Tax=Cymbomonas tetramitiformis TaxID=36881 RepID=A0AAE0L5F2_9CHLO|nr:hypothetical protein CYMTET_46944 [Cymbomonas tetramitiformis]KAK3247081.1 hypothetical protein CYMTET_43409 [Cymbomonas tetramitiformis]KAK3272507.1 hypothetical protein CYMTET_19203 [Cymbomonas tetramitiformis]